MAIIYKNFREHIVNVLPLIILYYLSISEIDTHFSNFFEILSSLFLFHNHSYQTS